MLILLVPVVMTLLISGAGPVSAATLNVCLSVCWYTQIAPAVAAAKDGDTMKVGPGTYRGGITINVSIRLAGAGAGSTVIRGGAHVLTLGAFGASSEPTVSVSGVTVTGGIARSSPESVPFYGEEGVAAGGGGEAWKMRVVRSSQAHWPATAGVVVMGDACPRCQSGVRRLGADGVQDRDDGVGDGLREHAGGWCP